MVLKLMICCLIFVHMSCGTNTENLNSITVDDNDFLKLNDILLNNNEYIQLISELRHTNQRNKRETKRAPTDASTNNVKVTNAKLTQTTAGYSSTKFQDVTETPIRNLTSRRPANKNKQRTRTTKPSVINSSTGTSTTLSTAATSTTKVTPNDKNKEVSLSFFFFSQVLDMLFPWTKHYPIHLDLIETLWCQTKNKK